MTPSTVGLSEPAYLLFILVPLGWLIYDVLSSRIPVRLYVQSSLPALRMGVLLLLILALCGPVVPWSTGSANLVFLMDRSESISASELSRGIRFINGLMKRLNPDSRAAIVVFGGEALLERPLLPPHTLEDLSSDPSRLDTNLEGALQLGTALLSGDAGRIILISDGNETVGKAERSVLRAVSAGVTVDAFVLGQEPEGERGLRIRQVSAPDQVRTMEPFPVTVELAGKVGVNFSIQLFVDGAAAARSEGVIPSGNTARISFSQSLTQPGPHVITAAGGSSDGAHFASRQEGTVVVAEGRRRILLVSERPIKALAEISRSAGFEVLQVDPLEFRTRMTELAQTSVVVFDDVSVQSLESAQMRQLVDYVHTLGGGFVMLGGHRSFGPGGYRNTEIERMLPVDLRVRNQGEDPSLAVTLLIDKSGSMAELDRDQVKIDLVKDATLSLIDGIEADQEIGLIAFDRNAREILPLAKTMGRGIELKDLLSLRPGGSTALLPALELAVRQLDLSSAQNKQILLLSDGRAESVDFSSLLDELVEKEIGISVVGVGDEIDRPLLEMLADRTGGRFYLAESFGEVKEIFLREISAAAGQWFVDQEVVPTVNEFHPIISNIGTGGFPSLGGYIATTPKTNGEHILTASNGDPLLSAGRFGLGRTVAFTSDLSSPWTNHLWEWEDLTRLWAQILGWAGGPAIERDLVQPAVTLESGSAMLDLFMVDSDGVFVNGVQVTGQCLNPDAEEIPLELRQTGPGFYQGNVPARHPGGYRLNLAVNGKDRGFSRSLHLGFWVSDTPENRAEFPNQDLLQSVVSLGNGQLLEEDSTEGEKLGSAGGSLDLSPWAIRLALILLIIDLAVRRGLRWDDLISLDRFRRRTVTSEAGFSSSSGSG